MFEYAWDLQLYKRANKKKNNGKNIKMCTNIQVNVVSIY